MKTLSILLYLGCGASVAGPAGELPSATDPAETAVAEPQVEHPLEPLAEGAQLAGGRLGSVLPGLVEGTWADIEGLFGPAGGIGGASDHIVERNTSEGNYELHIVAWESFRQIHPPRHESRRLCPRACP